MSKRRNILLIEEGDLLGPALRRILSNHDIQVDVIHDPVELLVKGRERAAKASCILVEDGLRAPGSVAVVHTLRERGCDTPIIVAAYRGTHAVATEFLEAGATDVIGLPLIYAYLMNRLGDFDETARTAEIHTLVLRGGTEVAFRFLHPQDADMEQSFTRGLSDKSRYMRFFTPIKELPPGLLEVFTHNEFPRSYAVIATVNKGDEETQIGVARYAPTDEKDTAEFAVVVADEWQGFGLATSLMHVIIVAAAVAGYRQLDGVMLEQNEAMLGLSKKLGFQLASGYPDGPGVYRVRKTLSG